jgi:hypothetical protein
VLQAYDIQPEFLLTPHHDYVVLFALLRESLISETPNIQSTMAMLAYAGSEKACFRI